MRIIIELDDKIQSTNMASNIIADGVSITNAPTNNTDSAPAINAGASKAQQSPHIQDDAPASIFDLDSNSTNFATSDAINAGGSHIG